MQGNADGLASLFGTSMSTRSVHGRPVRSHAGPLVVPAVLRGQVQAAVGLSDEPLMHPRSIPFGFTPTDFNHAYHLGGDPAAGTGLTVGTVQFSDWDPADASVYAQAAGIGLLSGQISDVRAGDQSRITTDPGGALEVALDVETLLALAPGASQRVYIAGNDGADILANYDALLQDAQQGLVQVASVSWGACEADSAGLITYLSPIIAGIVSAGVTVFAASGDTGSADCPGATGPAVDYPASDPSVVGVGGTSLAAPAWTETAWPKSGGGVSQEFVRPPYQPAVPDVAGRVVPDVASDADPATGLGLYLGGGWVKAGGTSLAAPSWAGGLTSTLAAAGCTRGLGDIHAVLYSHPAAFRDITAGVNGAYSSTTGYDAVTGLGSPLWDALGPVVSAPCGSPATVPAAPTGANATPGNAQAVVSWTPAASDGGSAVTGYTVTATPGGKTGATTGATTATITGLTNGTSYTFTVTATNTVGTSAASAASAAVTPQQFNDVPSSSPFYGDVQWLVYKGVTTGYPDGGFHPAAAVSRQAMAAFLYKLTNPAQSAPACASAPFTDVPASNQFCGAIAWLVGQKITGGYADGGFHPAAAVSRQAMAAFLYTLTNPALSAPLCASAPFTDVPASNQFCGAIAWLVGQKITGGYADGGFHPAAAVSRQAMAAFLHRLNGGATPAP